MSSTRRLQGCPTSAGRGVPPCTVQQWAYCTAREAHHKVKVKGRVDQSDTARQESYERFMSADGYVVCTLLDDVDEALSSQEDRDALRKQRKSDALKAMREGTAALHGDPVRHATWYTHLMAATWGDNDWILRQSRCLYKVRTVAHLAYALLLAGWENRDTHLWWT